MQPFSACLALLLTGPAHLDLKQSAACATDSLPDGLQCPPAVWAPGRPSLWVRVGCEQDIVRLWVCNPPSQQGGKFLHCAGLWVISASLL